MSEHYAVIGNPVVHSRSPDIHTAFARQTAQDIRYLRVLAPLDGFAAAVAMLRSEGARGANVTVPFKEEAFRLANALSDRARIAGAVNTLSFGSDGVLGDNTDGIGLVCDLVGNLKLAIANKRLLLLGAGGAARGAIDESIEIQRAVGVSIPASALVRAVALSLPAGVLLEKIDLDYANVQGTNKKIRRTNRDAPVLRELRGEIAGIAANESDVGRIVDGLSALAPISQVSLESSRSREFRGQGTREFRINFKVDLERRWKLPEFASVDSSKEATK